MHSSPYTPLARQFMELWQKQMASVLTDRDFVQSMMEMMQSMHTPDAAHAHAKPQPAADTTISPDALHDRLAQCERRIQQLEKRLASLEALPEAVNAEAQVRLASLLDGVKRYREIPYTRITEEPPVVWQHGSARLLDYAPAGEAASVMLLIPSLINRYYILDLTPKQSFARYLTGKGHRVLMLDWGAPGEREQGYDCTAYVEDHLVAALRFLHKELKRPITLGGYCMGGVFALALALTMPRAVNALALFATPWDFHAADARVPRLDKTALAQLNALFELQPEFPAEWIQALFSLNEPWVFQEKFQHFSTLKPGSREAENFIALEHWVNDGVPKTARAARDCLVDWGQRNVLACGEWEVAGRLITPDAWNKPAFVAVPSGDRIVPPGCALPLSEQLPQANVCRPSAGHVGMIVGSRAEKELWEPFAGWLKSV